MRFEFVCSYFLPEQIPSNISQCLLSLHFLASYLCYYAIIRRGYVMEQVLPVVIGCSVGIALCVVYLICLALKGLLSKFWANHPKHIEIEDNVLTIDLKKRKK